MRTAQWVNLGGQKVFIFCSKYLPKCDLDDQQTTSDSLNASVNTRCKYPRIYDWVFMDFLKTNLIRSVFELEKCSFFLNGSEFRQKLIGTIISAVFPTK